MKLSQLWPMVAAQAGTADLKAVEGIVRAFARAVVAATAAGERVTLRELGTFRGRPRKGRAFTRPQGGHHVVEPRTVLTFRAAEKVRILRRGP